MKNKIKNNYSIIRKFILVFAITLVVMFGYNFALEYKESKNSYKINDNDKLLLIKYTLVDKDKVPEGSSIDDLWANHFDALYNIVMDNVVLQKEGDYYVADISYTNDIITNDISDVDFAMNNNLGQVLDDCKFDKENLKIYIPTKYYEKTQTPVQTQIMSRIDNDQITVNYKKGNKKRSVVSDIYDDTVKLPIVDNEVAGHKLNSNDITVYVNGKKYYLDKSNSQYYKNGSLDINYNGALVDNIEVKVDRKNIFRKAAEKIFAATIVKASGISGVDFSGYSSITSNRDKRGLRKSEIANVSEDDVWYLSGNENTYRVRVILELSDILTKCNDATNKDIAAFNACALYPFSNYLNIIYNGAVSSGVDETSVTSSNYNNFCLAYARAMIYPNNPNYDDNNEALIDQKNKCNNYYSRVYACVSAGNSLNSCKHFAYFEGSNSTSNYDRLKNAFNGFLASYPYLIFKAQYGCDYTRYDCSASDAPTNNNVSTLPGAQYTDFLYRYVMLNDNSYPTQAILGTDKQANVIQWIRLPKKDVATTNIDSSRKSTSSTLPLNVYYSMRDVEGYVAAPCGHIQSATDQEGLLPVGEGSYDPSIDHNNVVLGIKIAKKTSDYLVIAFASQPPASGTGQGQATFALYKFDIFDDTKNKLKVTKQYKGDSSDTVTGNEVFKVYEATPSNGSYVCNPQVGEKLTYSNGAFVKESGLINDKPYCLIEEYNNKNFDVKYYSGNTNVTRDLTLNGNTVKGAIINFDSDGAVDSQGYYNINIKVENTRKKYCYAVKKVDAETNDPLKSKGSDDNKKFTFTSNGQTVSTTTSSNIATFGPFKYSSSYKISEVNVPEGVTAHNNYTYWTIGDPIDVPTNKLFEASYNASTNTYTCPTISDTNCVERKNFKKYYCARIRKVDASDNNKPLAGAKFRSTFVGYNSSGEKDGYTKSDGYYYFFTGNNKNNISVEEYVVPDGYYAPEITKTVTPVVMAMGTTKPPVDGDSSSYITSQINACKTAYSSIDDTLYKNYRYVLNWYKVDEKGALSNGAKFIVKNPDGKYLKLGAVKEQLDNSNPRIKKNCYPLLGTTTNRNEATVVKSQNVGIDSTMKGEVCISGLMPGNYTVIETDSIEYHTFGSESKKTIAANEKYQVKKNDNTFINYPTRIELEKKSTDPDEDTNSELAKIAFSIFAQDENGNPTGNPITVKQTGVGTYDYITSGTETTIMHVNPEDAVLSIEHLPKGKYVATEMQGSTCDDSGNPDDCIGYYMPSGSKNIHRFEITKCSSDYATSCGVDEYGKIIVTIMNTPTEINFDELDYYRHYDMEDIAIEGNTVEGETSTGMDRSDFDRMIFSLYDKNDNPVSLQFVGNHGDCTHDGDYAEYRYVAGKPGSTELHTCGGHIKITHLCRGSKYTIKELSVADDSVFVYGDTPSTPMQKDYQVACDPTDPDEPRTETNIIENKPTRVTFEKRDAKYNYLIPDETTTFEVYRCPKGEECHPGNYASVEAREAAGIERVVFSPRDVIRTTINGQVREDEEDPGLEVYRMVSFSDKKNMIKCENGNRNNCYETEVHPYLGKLVFRYLSSGYNYVLLETVAPKNYLLPEGIKAETAFTVRNDTVDVDYIDVPNQPTGIIIRKYDNEGVLLGGAKFKVSKVTNYNPNKKPQDQEMEELKFKTIKQGVYENRPVLDTNLVITCEGPNCSDTNTFSYDKNWSNFDELLTSSGEKVKDVLKEGTAIIQYLEYDNYYVIEEVEAPKGHSLPSKEDDRFTIVHIGANTTVIEDTEMKFVNYPTPYTFYKFDEYNNLLDGAKFKLQKLNDNKSYVTVKVSKVEGEESLYKAFEGENEIIETTNGKATVYYLEEGQYRIVEVEAAEGKELPKKTINVATFFVDKEGKVYGENIITNKKPTEKTYIKPEAKANLIITIQTGQTVVKYGLIIAVLIAGITGLMILLRKRK